MPADVNRRQHPNGVEQQEMLPYGSAIITTSTNYRWSASAPNPDRSMFAPCLLGCPEPPRYTSAALGTHGEPQVARDRMKRQSPVSSSTRHQDKNEQGSGLLIC